MQRRGEIAEAIEKWRSIARVAVETDKQLAARAWYSVGYLLWDGQTEKSKAESAQEAISAYDKAIELKPDFHAAYVNRGVAKRRLGLLDEAIADYDKAIELKPDDYVAYNNRCFAKGEKDNFEEAISDCNKAATLRPSYPNTYSSRCYVYGQWDRFREAIADCDKAIRLKPDYHEAFYYRGIAKSGSDTDLKSEAREDLKTALQLSHLQNSNSTSSVKLTDFDSWQFLALIRHRGACGASPRSQSGDDEASWSVNGRTSPVHPRRERAAPVTTG